MKKVAIIIPTYNRCKLLKISLGQLLEQSHKISSFTTKIIVVNDGCTDETEEMLTINFPEVIQKKTKGNYWYTQSMNVGFKEALKIKANYVLTLNDDIELKDNYLISIFNAISKFSEPVIMGSTSVTYEKPNRITFSGVKEIKWWRFKQYNYHKYLEQVPINELEGEKESILLPGRGMLIDAKILKEIGFFQETLLQYASDDEFCYRASKKGFKIYVSWDAIVYSHHKLTGDGTPQLKQPLNKFLKSFFNKYSRNYWKKHFFIIWNYGIKILFPLTISIIFLGEFYSYFKYRLK